MIDTNQKHLGNTFWSIADQLCKAINADDCRDDMPFRSNKSKRINFIASRK